MTMYRLNEIWSSFEVGDEFKLSDCGNGDLYQLVDGSDNYVLAKIPTDLLEEIDDGGGWKPKDGEDFYYMDEDGDVHYGEFDIADRYDKQKLSIGNCFRTKKDAEAMFDWLKARQRLIDSGARFVNSQDIGTDKRHYIVYFDVSGEKLTFEDILLNEHSVYQKRLCF